MPKPKPNGQVIIKSCKFCLRLFSQKLTPAGGRPVDFCEDSHKKRYLARKQQLRLQHAKERSAKGDTVVDLPTEDADASS